MNQKNVLEQLDEFKQGKFDNKDCNTQVEAGWFDWFCNDRSLANKTKKLYGKVNSVLKANEKGKRFNPKKVYVSFKNNCPGDGHLYDSFFFVDIKTDDVVFWITPSSGYKKEIGQAQVAGPENGFKENLVEGCWKDILSYFSFKKE